VCRTKAQKLLNTAESTSAFFECGRDEEGVDYKYRTTLILVARNEVTEEETEIRQNSLERKENYGLAFSLNKVPLSHFPPSDLRNAPKLKPATLRVG
jgi:hypothetical protein